MKSKAFFRIMSFVPVLSVAILTECKTELPPVILSKSISGVRNDIPRKATDACLIRYAQGNNFIGLSDKVQLSAVSDAFSVWQKANKNVLFLNYSVPEKAEILIKFVEPSEIGGDRVFSGGGLFPIGIANLTSGKFAGKQFIISIDNTYPWTKESLSRAIAYHAGLFLGMGTSDNASSIMNPYLNDKIKTLSLKDSLSYNQLYSSSCRDLDCNFLPISFKLNTLVNKCLKIEKEGTVVIKASGQIWFGQWLQYGKPDGRADGLFGFPLTGYKIVPELNFGALMYKLNQEKSWHPCGSECEFKVGANQYLDLSLDVNDNEKGDNAGEFDILINYK
ncbi:hypothetical protein SAMN04515674_101152 [Pseudarcicella hirudinis]|uniref:Peptidase M10 metallopeptidase domain-containing protein n=2 Tax=Pseudarcicella hirudinis TaxID=1079859 RepID=A0A1I5M666_9BACT|nr:matrixin family metalloprotease [Pseudarcicella hirudinis]SFP05062.1 hypothetical protein SAMN04515674_101152 [Pseudarcicella hirudinis]